MYLHIFSFNEEPKKTAPEPEKHFKCFNDHDSCTIFVWLSRVLWNEILHV